MVGVCSVTGGARHNVNVVDKLPGPRLGATGLKCHVRAEEMICRVCPQRPVAHTELRLCQWHLGRWTHYENASGGYADLAAWLGEQLPLPGYGSCRC